jgi:hypothetical protein
MKSLFKHKRNKKGQMIVVNIMIAMACIITAIIFIEPLKDVIDIGRTDLDCANYASLTTGEAMTCIGLDFLLPMFILLCFGVGLAYLGAKRLGGM